MTPRSRFDADSEAEATMEALRRRYQQQPRGLSRAVSSADLWVHGLNKYLKPDLLIIDDMGLKILPAKSGEILLEIIMRRYENRSTMMTSNRPIEEWGKLLSDVSAASAILDRLLHYGDYVNWVQPPISIA